MALSTETSEHTDTTGTDAFDKRYDDLRVEFLAWLMDPDRPREETQRQWAAAHRVHEDTVSKWKHSPEAREILLRWQEPYRVKFVEIAKSLFSAATDHEHPQMVQAARTMAELLNMYPEKKPQGLDIRLTVAQLYAEAARALESGEVIEGEVSSAPAG